MRPGKNNSGQAMTEFVIVAALVLVPMLIIYPLIGKFIDMKHSAVEASRYIAWERTVWYEISPSDSGAPIKKKSDLQKEATRRLLSRTDLDVKSSDDQGWLSADRNTLWRDHRGGELLVQYSDMKPKQNNEKKTPSIAYSVIRGFNSAVGKFYAPLKALGLVSDPTFFTVEHSLKAYYEPQISLDVSNIANLQGFDQLDLVMTGKSAILADGWTAQGDNQFSKRSRDFVPSALMDNPVMNTFIKIATFKLPVFGVAMAPEVGGLEFGYIGTDEAGAGKPNCKKGGKKFNACEY